MAITKVTLSKGKEFLKAIEIADKVMEGSILIPEATKQAFRSQHVWMYELVEASIEKGRMDAAGLNSLVRGFLVFWNESAGIDVEIFWSLLIESSVSLERKDILEYALKKRSFRNIHQAMSARLDWGRLQKSSYLKKRYSAKEISDLNEIVEKDELKRMTLVRKCLKNNNIPDYQLLKYNENVVYLDTCNILNKYFTEKEQEMLQKLR